ETPNTHPITTGLKILIRCLAETMNMAAIVATKVTIMLGTNISVGLEAFKEALTAITPTGIRLKPAACRQRNMIWELEAVSLLGFSSCRLSIAFSPKGVLALSSPRRLAEK